MADLFGPQDRFDPLHDLRRGRADRFIDEQYAALRRDHKKEDKENSPQRRRAHEARKIC
jgi:hypothetical protein